MVSIIWDKRSFPVYFELLSKLGSSNLEEQKRILSQVFPIVSNYNVCVLGDREFCSVNHELTGSVNRKYIFVYV